MSQDLDECRRGRGLGTCLDITQPGRQLTATRQAACSRRDDTTAAEAAVARSHAVALGMRRHGAAAEVDYASPCRGLTPLIAVAAPAGRRRLSGTRPRTWLACCCRLHRGELQTRALGGAGGRVSSLPPGTPPKPPARPICRSVGLCGSSQVAGLASLGRCLWGTKEGGAVSKPLSDRPSMVMVPKQIHARRRPNPVSLATGHAYLPCLAISRLPRPITGWLGRDSLFSFFWHGGRPGCVDQPFGPLDCMSRYPLGSHSPTN